MRGIRFRGQRVGGNEWVYGDLIHDKNGFPHIAPQEHGFDIDDDRFKIYEVNPVTIGQFTGVLDSTEQDVYDGDIIRHGQELFEIQFEDGCFWRRNDGDTMELHTILGMGNFKVFSNVYDDPDILDKQIVSECERCGCERVFVPSSLTDDSYPEGSGKSDLFECCECQYVQTII